MLADGVDDLRDEGHRGDGAGVATRLGALGDDEVAPAGDGSDGVAHLAAHRTDDDVGVVQGVDDVAGHAQAGDEQCSTAVDDVPDAGLHLVGHGGQQVDAERLRRARPHRCDLVGQLGRAHRRRAEGADAAGLGHSCDEAMVGDTAHPGAHHRMVDAEQVGEPRPHDGRPYSAAGVGAWPGEKAAMPAPRSHGDRPRLVLEHPPGEVAPPPRSRVGDDRQRRVGATRVTQDATERCRHAVVGDELTVHVVAIAPGDGIDRSSAERSPGRRAGR